jgi:hypothetical protein
MPEIIPPFSTTGIGSMPHIHPEEACELILGTFDIPFWPQLPQRFFKESMIAQYSEGMPYLKINENDRRIFVQRDENDELERFYESQSDNARAAISEDFAAGFHTFLRMIKDKKFKILKGHITGPLTYTLGLKDSSGRSIFFDEELREIASMLLQAKSRWQIDMLKQNAESVIIFIDEPIFSAIGSSSYLGVDSAEVLRILKDAVSAIENAGGIAGIHCCGKADWALVMQSGVRILNFDAYEYFDTIAMYHNDLRNFLETGGYLAWGMVPTSDVINSLDSGHLAALMNGNLKKLYEHLPPDLVVSRILLTPSCGAGSRSIKEADKICKLIMRLKEAMV